jgi:DNA-directed RNA polymerase specialized sigma24 family protein
MRAAPALNPEVPMVTSESDGWFRLPALDPQLDTDKVSRTLQSLVLAACSAAGERANAEELRASLWRRAEGCSWRTSSDFLEWAAQTLADLAQQRRPSRFEALLVEVRWPSTTEAALRLVTRELKRIPQPGRMLASKHLLDGRSVDEIAAELGMQLHQVRGELHAVGTRLRCLLRQGSNRGRRPGDRP